MEQMVQRFEAQAQMSDVIALGVVAFGLAVAGIFYTVVALQTAFAKSTVEVDATDVEFAVEEAID